MECSKDSTYQCKGCLVATIDHRFRLCDRCTIIIDRCNLRNEKLPNLPIYEGDKWHLAVLNALEMFIIVHGKPPTNPQISAIASARYEDRNGNRTDNIWDKGKDAVARAKTRLRKLKILREPQPHDYQNKTKTSTRNSVSIVTKLPIAFHTFPQCCSYCDIRELPPDEYTIPIDWKVKEHKSKNINMLLCKHCAGEYEVWERLREKF